MALNVKAGTLAPPASNGGTTTISLGAGFDPKALIVFAGNRLSAGVDATGTMVSLGFATKDGGAIQQGYVENYDQDNSGTAVLVHGINTTRCVMNASAGATVIAEAHVAAAGDWTDSQIVLTWPTTSTTMTAATYLVLGGSDITAARCGEFPMTTAAATQDVVVATGWGRPDLLMFQPSNLTALGNVANSHMQHGLGIAKSDTDRVCSLFHGIHAHTSNVKYSYQKARALLSFVAPGSTVDAEADLSGRLSWPTDGFQLAYADQAASAFRVLYLALKGSFTSTIVNPSTLTTGTTQDLAHGSPPKAFMSCSTLVPAVDTVESAHAQLGGLSFGVSDLTNEGAVISGSDAGAATSITWNARSTTKALYTCDQPTSASAAPVERAQADATADGDNLRLTYTTLDSVAREYIGLILGDAPTTARPRVPMLGHHSQSVKRGALF